jgi:hypothetical protein
LHVCCGPFLSITTLSIGFGPQSIENHVSEAVIHLGALRLRSRPDDSRCLFCRVSIPFQKARLPAVLSLNTMSSKEHMIFIQFRFLASFRPFGGGVALMAFASGDVDSDCVCSLLLQ